MGNLPFPVNLSTACLIPLPLATSLRYIAEAGYDGVELVLTVEVARLGANKTLALAREHGLGVHTVHQPLTSQGRWRTLEARAEAAVRLALDMGCTGAIVHVPFAHHDGAPWVQQWMKAVERWLRFTERSGLRIALENPPYAAHISRLPILSKPSELVSFAEKRGLAVTFDTCHAGAARLDLVAAFQALRPVLANIHLSDRKASARGLVGGRIGSILTDHQMPGAGDLPLGALIRRLVQDGYTGPLTIEVNPVALGSLFAPTRRRNLQRILAYVRQAGQGG